MSVLDLFIPDVALKNAISEQLSTSDLGILGQGTDFSASLQSPDVSAILLDEASADKKIEKLLAAREAPKKGKLIFLLGEAKEGWVNFITESFPKPLRLGHLLARLQFHLQLSDRRNTLVSFGPYKLEILNRQVTIEGGEIIRLTEKETALLDYLGQSDEPVMRDELLAAIWGYDAHIDTHTLETHIYQLRRKLDPQNTGVNWLINEQGAYRLNREGA